MVRINNLSNNFSHAYSSTWWKKPKNLIWDFHSKSNNISVYIDNGGILNGIKDKNDGKLKFLWLLESKQFDGGAHNLVKELLPEIKEVFTEVWTHSDELIALDNIFKWSPAYGTYINDGKVHDKTKLVSMITSNKQITEQHKFRYKYAINNINKIDVFGRGFVEIQNKEDGLNEYMFSVAIENDTYDTYFTEKILDCFATGTIPIYKGSKNINKYFNEDGIIFLEDNSLNNLSKELYYSKIDAIKENYNLVKDYDVLDDWIFNNYLKKYI